MDDDLKKLKQTIEQLDKELEGLSVMDFDNAMLIKASRNSKAREYNRRKKFWQLSIKTVY